MWVTLFVVVVFINGLILLPITPALIALLLVAVKLVVGWAGNGADFGAGFGFGLVI